MIARAECSVCGDIHALNANGTVRAHPALSGANRCRGSNRPPSEHVHKCLCGARWDEHATSPG